MRQERFCANGVQPAGRLYSGCDSLEQRHGTIFQKSRPSRSVASSGSIPKAAPIIAGVLRSRFSNLRSIGSVDKMQLAMGRFAARLLGCLNGRRASMQISKVFGKFASRVSQATGRPVTFAVCILVVLIWAVSGPLFHFSDTWQLIINTGTTIVTFLMVFLIQNTQNRDGAAIQAKLDELIRTSAAQNTFIGIEQLTEEELGDIRKACEARAQAAGNADLAQFIANRKAQQAADCATS